MSACESLAWPWMTLMKSKTTRRSAPRTRSRLRSPTSKSTTATLSPVIASAAPSAAVDVVLPTPPLPEVTTKTVPMCFKPPRFSIQKPHCDYAINELDLDRPADQFRLALFRRQVIAVDRDELRLELPPKDARPR